MNKFRQTKLGRRISLSFILLISLTFVLVLLLTTYNTFRILSREYALRLTQELGNLTDSLDQSVNDLYKINETIQNDARLKESILSWYDHGNEESASYASDQLSRIRGVSRLMTSLFLYDRDTQLIASFDNIRRSDSFASSLQEAARTFSEGKAYRAFVPIGDSLFYFCSLFEDDYRYNACLALDINTNLLFFRVFPNDLKLFSDVHITDGANWITDVGDPLPEEPASILASDTFRRGGRTYLVLQHGSKSYPGWSLIGLYDQSLLFRDIMRQLFPLILVFLVTIPAVILISVLIARRITRPIEELSGSMQLVEQGQYPPPLSIRQDDEVGTLVEGYNHMVGALQQLHTNLLEEQNEKRKIEVAELNTRLKLLQSQINPHFIYNTLNTMNYMAQEAGNEELSGLIYSFSSLLRSSISADSDFVPVHTEIDSVKYYLEIQSHRYADIRLDCIYEIEPDTRNLLLPRMILQPLVENSLIHGILPTENGEGTIRIRCSRRNDFLYVHISDNGVGIPPEKLEKLRTGELKVSNGYNHIGLNNVRERLEILYQQDCRFTMLSREGEGTALSFRVPVKE